MEPKNSGSKEFGILLLLLAAAVFFALNLNLKGCGKAETAKKEEPADKTAGTAPGDKWAEGKALFKSNCAACHNTKADGTGPALMGAHGRWLAAGEYQGKTGEQWLHEWIKNWNTPVTAGYPYAVDMANSRPTQMNLFTGLKDEEITQILQYIDSGSVAKN